jgi:hypothetical protein
MTPWGRRCALIIAALAAVGLAGRFAATALSQEPVSSRAYVGHENDADMKGFIRQYPKAVGTRLDDCQTCHRGGIMGRDTEREYSPCSYCHLLEYPNARYATGVPKTANDTLNAYGRDYLKAGRKPEAFMAIDSWDSDGDGTPNGSEVADLRNPGDAASRPGLPQAATIVFGWDEIKRLPVQTQFMLLNTTKEPTDHYVVYTGVRVLDLLSAAKVFMTGVTGITVFAPDGYSVDYSVKDIIAPFPRGYYYAAPRAFEGTERAFVKYPQTLPAGLMDGKRIPGEPWLLLAYARDGAPLDPSVYEKGTGRLAGDGPYGLFKPMRYF